MSTFIFAPSWVKYDQPLKQETKDEFPTLISHHNNNINNEKQKQHSVWFNSHLTQQKIHHPMDDGIRQELELDKRHQLEKLKALVPKITTKKSISSRNHKSSGRPSYPSQFKKSTTPTTTTKPSLTLKPKEHTNIEISTTTTTTTTTMLSTTTTHTKEETSIESFTSQKELQKFIHFLKYWTSTRITPHVDNNHREYSYFNNTPINSNGGSDLDDQTSDINNCSLFQYDPFPLQ